MARVINLDSDDEYQPIARVAPQQQQQPGRPLTNGYAKSASPVLVLPRGDAIMKMRMQLARNGNYNIVPRRAHSPTMVVPVSGERAECYAFDAEVDDEAGAETVVDGVMSNHRFRCTYSGCNQLIFGNVNFMNHVWAHVAVWKPSHEAECEKGKTDVDAIACCPQCFARFETPYTMQVHYTRAHSRIKQSVSLHTCGVCEREVTSMAHHLARHDPNEAPYRCPLCSFRSNIRMHLYDHFCRKHAHGTTLMCPFCTFKTEVNLVRKRRHVIKATDFVNHMRRHEFVSDRRELLHQSDSSNGGACKVGNSSIGGVVSVPASSGCAEKNGVEANVDFDPEEAQSNRRRIACDRCARCFTNQNERYIHLLKDHMPLSARYTKRKRYKVTERRDRRVSELRLMAKGEHAMCADCKKAAPESRPSKCPMCARAVFSIDAVAAKNISYSDNVIRPDVRVLATIGVEQGLCVCGFRSTVNNRLAAHFYKCRRKMRVKLADDEDDKKKRMVKREPTEEEMNDEMEEIALFGIEVEKEQDSKRRNATLKELSEEIEREVAKRVAAMRDIEETVTKKSRGGGASAVGTDSMTAQLSNRKKAIDSDLTGALLFRIRLSRNDLAASEKLFREVMAKRNEK